MIENVGKDFIPEYWRVVDWALKEDNAIGMVQVISMPESRMYQVPLFLLFLFRIWIGVSSYDRHIDFVQKWVSTTILEGKRAHVLPRSIFLK